MTHVINEAAIFSTDKNGRALVADLQYFETYTSTALNRKLKGIVNAGVYRGFKPLIGDGLSIIISSTDAEERIGVASVDVGESQITIQQILDVNVLVPAGKTTIIALEANYEFGKLTDQVDSSSTLKATQIITVDVATGLAGNQIELCRVIVPEDATAITEAMVDISHRISQAIGIQLSADLESDAENIGASSKAINDLRKKLLGEESQEGLDTISALAKALGGDPDFVENLSKALKGKQPLNNSLSSLSGLQSSANKLPYFNGKDTMSLSDLSQTGRDLISKDSIDKIFEYLRLGESATRAVGSLVNQIPDMSFFANSYNGASGFCKLPSGVILQTIAINAIPAGGSIEVVYPMVFPSQMSFVIAAPANANNGTIPISLAIDAVAVTDSKKSIIIRNISTIANAGTRLFAIGR